MRKIVVALALVCICAGCKSQTEPDSVSVSARIAGVVSLNGTPVAGATVLASTGAAVLTDDSGRYCIAVPTFAEVTLTAVYRSRAEVRADDWLGIVVLQSSDFSSCEHAQRQDTALVADPI